MSWTIVFLLVGFWVLGLINGYSLGGLIHILLVYAGLMVIARLVERARLRRGSEYSHPVARTHLNAKDS
jgi:hypothetical protein